MTGPLSGLRVVELEGRGPGPFAAMILADLGADVVRIGRTELVDMDDSMRDTPYERVRYRKVDVLSRGRRSVAIDLKHPGGLASALRLIDRADVLIENLRPGAAEALGLGSAACLERNPRLIYAQITGWGQTGPKATKPGHDINFVALSGILEALRPGVGEAPHAPLNLLGNFGGGGMILLIGVLSALVERNVSGQGQVVDATMLEGAALLSTIYFGLHAEGLFSETPATNLLDYGTAFYNVYETADGRYISLAAVEAPLYAELLSRLELGEDEVLLRREDPSTWPEAKRRLADIFKTKTREEWCELLEDVPVGLAPVLNFDEAPKHPHNVVRGVFVEIGGVVQPAPAPRFSRTPASAGSPIVTGQHTTQVLLEAGFSPEEIDQLMEARAVRQALDGAHQPPG